MSLCLYVQRYVSVSVSVSVLSRSSVRMSVPAAPFRGGQPPTGRIICLTDEPEKREEKPEAAT